MTLLQAIRRRHEMAGAVRDRHFHAIALPVTSSLARCNTSDITDGFCEPQVPIRSRNDISWATIGCRRRLQGDRTACGDTTDRAHVRSKVLIGKPEIAVWPCCDAAQVKVIITRAWKRKQGDLTRRGN